MAKDNKLEKRIKELEKYASEQDKEKLRLQEQINDLTKQDNYLLDFEGKRCRIGVISDTHKGSLYENQRLEDSLIKYFNDNGVDMILHCGDVLDGEKMYKGHEYEIDVHGADAQIKHFVENFPETKAPMYFITGNHDDSYWKKVGVDVGSKIDEERPDLHFIGKDQKTIELTPECKIMLMHPGGGTAYAISYKSQKLIESLTGGEKPNILLSGHYHKYDHLFFRNVHGFQVPCTQKQTPFMARKPTPAMQGGLMMDVYIDKDGISKLKNEYLPYYEK